MIKILLISKINSYKYGNTGLDYILQFLRDNNIHADSRYYHNNETIDYIKNDNIFDYDIIGFSTFDTNYNFFLSLAKEIKDNNPNCICVMGGQFITMNHYFIDINSLPIDYLILGDGEHPLLRIVNHHKYTSTLLKNDSNIITKNDKQNKIINIEDHTKLKHAYDYYDNDSPERNKNKTHCIMTKSNICIGTCTFCCSRKGKAIYRSAIDIFNEIEYMSKKYNVRKFFFVDDDIFDLETEENRTRLFELFIKIKRLNYNLIFSCFSKCKSICNENNRFLLNLMKSIGFRHIFLGIDAGNEQDRQLYNKSSTLIEGIKAINILNEIGIPIRYGLIFINPYSTLDTFKNNYRYLVSLKSSNYYHYGGLPLLLLPGTKMYKITKQDNLINSDYSILNTSSYNFKNNEVQEIVNFLQSTLMPSLDSIKHQFLTMKRKFEIVQLLDESFTNKYSSFIKNEEKIQFKLLKDYFYHLYEENDLQWCKLHMQELITNISKNSDSYHTIIRECNNIFRNSKLEKENKCETKYR